MVIKTLDEYGFKDLGWKAIDEANKAVLDFGVGHCGSDNLFIHAMRYDCCRHAT